MQALVRFYLSRRVQDIVIGSALIVSLVLICSGALEP